MVANLFESQLERLARTLSEQYGVTVTCQGDEAWTDGRHIRLPSLPEPMDDALERMCIGFLDHEMGHVAFSNFKVVATFSKQHAGAEGLLNAVEDAFIERALMKRWPGVRANLDAMFRQIRDRVAGLIAKRDPFGRFCTAVYLKLSHHREMFGLEPELAGFDDLLDQFPGVRSTRDAAALSEQLLDRWSRQQPQQPERAPQTNSQDAEEPGEQASSGQSDNDAPRDDASSDPGVDGNASSGQEQGGGGSGADHEGSSGSDPVDESPSDSSSDDSPGGRPSGDADAGKGSSDSNTSVPDATPPQATDGATDGSSSDEPSLSPSGDASAQPAGDAANASGGQGGTSVVSEALAEAITDCVATFDSTGVYRVFTQQYDRIDVLPEADEASVNALLESGRDTVRRLRRGLTNALRSAEKRWWREDQSRGALSPRSLYRLATDRPRLDVFRTRSTVQGRSTAVCIILDASGSMTTKKMDVARDAVRVLLEALADLDVATEAFTFTTGNAFSVQQASHQMGADPTELMQRFSRFSNLEIDVIKRFDESVKTGLQRLPNVHGSGLTPLGEAMMIGAKGILPRAESRKVMLDVTDGRPGCDSHRDSALTHAQHVARMINKAGIELVGVGIGEETLCQIVTDTIVVNEINDLPAQLCKLLGRTLKKGLAHAG